MVKVVRGTAFRKQVVVGAHLRRMAAQKRLKTGSKVEVSNANST